MSAHDSVLYIMLVLIIVIVTRDDVKHQWGEPKQAPYSHIILTLSFHHAHNIMLYIG